MEASPSADSLAFSFSLPQVYAGLPQPRRPLSSTLVDAHPYIALVNPYVPSILILPETKHDDVEMTIYGHFSPLLSPNNATCIYL